MVSRVTERRGDARFGPCVSAWPPRALQKMAKAQLLRAGCGQQLFWQVRTAGELTGASQRLRHPRRVMASFPRHHPEHATPDIFV